MFSRKKSVLAVVLLVDLMIGISVYQERAGLVYATGNASEKTSSANEGDKVELTVSGGDVAQADESALSERSWELEEDVESLPLEEDGEMESESEVLKTDEVKISAPIYDYDIVDVIVPTSYAVALNPYGMPVRTGENTISDAQIISRNYGIVNRSTRDKIVTVTLLVEDLNEGRITFVDTREKALDADKDVYALYLTAVPAEESSVKLGGKEIDRDTTCELLSDVTMVEEREKAVPLRAGTNNMSFRLSKAMYCLENSEDMTSGTVSGNEKLMPELVSLAPNAAGVAAFTFDGVMNPDAAWEELLRGIRISVIYSYETAGSDKMALPEADEIRDSKEED